MRLLVICGVLAGCGGASGARPVTGSRVFAAECSACHSLGGRESPSRQGGDLLDFHFSRQVMREFAREMPVRHPLSARELRAVVDYVVGVERAGAARCSAPGC